MVRDSYPHASKIKDNQMKERQEELKTRGFFFRQKTLGFFLFFFSRTERRRKGKEKDKVRARQAARSLVPDPAPSPPQSRCCGCVRRNTSSTCSHDALKRCHGKQIDGIRKRKKERSKGGGRGC